MSESLTGRTRWPAPDLQCVSTARWYSRLRSRSQIPLERRVYLHTLEYTPLDFLDRLIQCETFAFDYEVTDPVHRECLPPIKTDVQARISGPTLALFLGGCILRSETCT